MPIGKTRVSPCVSTVRKAESVIGPAIFAGTGTTGWIECSRVYEIPEGATSLAFEPANFGSSGKVEFKKLTLELDEMK